VAHVTLKGWASEKSLSEVIPCSDRTAARVIAYLKSEGWVVKSGYGVIPAAKDSATNIPPPQIPRISPDYFQHVRRKLERIAQDR
jgi:hypothetical protein